VRLEGLGQLNNPMTSSEFEPATFQLLTLCLGQLRYRLPAMVFTVYDVNESDIKTKNNIISINYFKGIQHCFAIT
jgi:hypothetical protein